MCVIEIHGSNASLVVIVVTRVVSCYLVHTSHQQPKKVNIEQIFHSKLRAHKVSTIILQNHQTKNHLFSKLNCFPDFANLYLNEHNSTEFDHFVKTEN